VNVFSNFTVGEDHPSFQPRSINPAYPTPGEILVVLDF